jgi:hypothetical protein
MLSGFVFPSSVPIKSPTTTEVQSSGVTRKHWWQTNRLNVHTSLRNARWIEIVPADEVGCLGKRDSKLSLKLAFFGFISILFSYAALDIALESQMTEQKNRYNQWGKWLGVAGLVFFFTWFIALTFVSGSAI